MPMVLAAMAVATMALTSGARGPRRVSAELGYNPDPAETVTMTLDRYVGGHPDVAAPSGAPHVLLTPLHLAVFARRWGAKLFLIPWPKVEAVTVLDRDKMVMAAASVRGLAAGALEAGAAEGEFLRVRFEDERGWWQNVVFELGGPHAKEQSAEVERYWRQHGSEKAKESPPGDA